MEDELIRKVRDALNARASGPQEVNIVILMSVETVQRALDFLEWALKSGFLDGERGAVVQMKQFSKREV